LIKLSSDKHWQQPLLIWLMLILPAVAIECLEMLAGIDVRYVRSAILQGEWWRLLTGHLDHLGWAHLGLNAAFLVLLLTLFKPLQSWAKTLLLWLLICLAISFLMLFLSPQLQWYVGLSGSLYGLLIFGLVSDKNYALGLRFVISLIVIAKVMFEQLEGASAQVSQIISGPVAEESHLYGLMAGGLMVLFSFATKYLFETKK